MLNDRKPVSKLAMIVVLVRAKQHSTSLLQDLWHEIEIEAMLYDDGVRDTRISDDAIVIFGMSDQEIAELPLF